MLDMKDYYMVKPVCGATVVGFFLSLHDYWFRDASNSMYRKQEAAARYLLNLLDSPSSIADKQEPTLGQTNEVYLELKFTEWLESDWVIGWRKEVSDDRPTE